MRLGLECSTRSGVLTKQRAGQHTAGPRPPPAFGEMRALDAGAARGKFCIRASLRPGLGWSVAPGLPAAHGLGTGHPGPESV